MKEHVIIAALIEGGPLGLPANQVMEVGAQIEL
jgi:hypothetical protein